MVDATSLSFVVGDEISILMAVYEDGKYTRNEWCKVTIKSRQGNIIAFDWEGHEVSVDLTQYDVRRPQ